MVGASHSRFWRFPGWQRWRRRYDASSWWSRVRHYRASRGSNVQCRVVWRRSDSRRDHGRRWAEKRWAVSHVWVRVGPAGVVGPTSGGNGNIGWIVRGGGGIEANLVPKSISIDRGGSGEVIGVNFRRKRRLRSVTRPDPSTLTWYWSCCLTSTTVPVWSHLFGSCPVWFCIRT